MAHLTMQLFSSNVKSSFECVAPFPLNLRSPQRVGRPLVMCCSHLTESVVKSANSNREGGTNELKSPLVQGRRSLVASVVAVLLPALTNFSLVKSSFADEEIRQKIREALRKVITKAKAPGILRLVFHDAGTFSISTNKGGMNGSITMELERPENQGLNRSVKLLSKVKASLEPDVQVSWADLIAVAGAEAVSICGGPDINVKLGRRDSVEPDPEGQLPEESLSAKQLKDAFLGKGFTTQELVALSGAHSIGGKGFGDPDAFDNSYYKVLLQKPWQGDKSSMIGINSDRALPEDEECRKWIQAYADDQDLFFKDFVQAYLKLVNTTVV